ncbi:MAG: hypothetical protein WAK63_12890, partial [Xanthobacteraceae bacterium]
ARAASGTPAGELLPETEAEPHRWVRRIRISVYRRSASFFSFPGERKEEAKTPRAILKVEEPRPENPQRRTKIAPRERIFISTSPHWGEVASVASG